MGTEATEQAVAEVMAALSVGERLARDRARENVALAPNPGAGRQQQNVADREGRNAELLQARVRELGSAGLEERFEPFFRAFFERTVPSDWLEAQAFHYVGDSLVGDFADALTPVLDPVSAEVIRRTLADRADQSAFALDEITALIRDRSEEAERVADYARRVIGEALTQTRRALDETGALQQLLGGPEGEKRLLLDLLDHHRGRMDRLGIELVD